MNGHLKKHCHGTRNVLPQLVRNLRFHQALLDKKHNTESHMDGVRGRVKHKRLCTTFVQALSEANFFAANARVPVFPRYWLNGVLYKTWKTSKQLRNSSVCQFKKENGVTAIVNVFVIVTKFL